MPKNVTIKEYKLSNSKNIIIRKIYNRFKLFKYIITNKNKYDVSICYATYDYVSSIIVRKLSEKPIMWVHSDYFNVFNKNSEKYIYFFSKRNINKFKKIIFVSNESKNTFVKFFCNLSSKTEVVNNLIDYEQILKKSKDIVKKNKKPLILFVGRLEEESKGLLLLFDIAKELSKYDFWVIGNGKDKKNYEQYIKNKKIINVKLLGSKQNPYSYMKIADILILPSIYEGFPVVTLEGLVLNKKIITTINVSANEFKLSDYSCFVKRDKKEIKKAIEKILIAENPNFNFEKYNKQNIDQTKNIIFGDYYEV